MCSRDAASKEEDGEEEEEEKEEDNEDVDDDWEAEDTEGDRAGDGSSHLCKIFSCSSSASNWHKALI